MAVLGAILMNNQALHLIQDGLQPDDFYVVAYRKVYEQMLGLAAANEAIDHITLGTALLRSGELDRIGGSEILDDLTDKACLVQTVESYAKIVRENAAMRRVIAAAQKIAAEGYGGRVQPEEYLQEAERDITQAAQSRRPRTEAKLSETLGETFSTLEAIARHTGNITGIGTGFTELDRLTGGLQSTDLIILAGRPAMGKTALALNMALTATRKHALPTLIFSMEMSKDQITRRFLASQALVNAQRLKLPNQLDVGDWQRMTEAATLLHTLPIHVDDAAAVTTMDIRSRARRVQAQDGLGLIVVDYLQLMKSADKKQSREQEVASFSRELKAIAKDLKVPVLALAQLNRSVESRPDKRPLMSDLRDSGGIEQDSDLIMFVYRDEYYHKDSEEPGVAELIISKHRSGPTGTVKLKFRGEFVRFDNLAEDEAPPGSPYGDTGY